jgi:TonB family protein
MVLLFAKLVLRIYQIIRLISGNLVVSEGKIKLVILEKETSPFSFLNYIFISKDLKDTPGWEKMLEHEKQHIRQGHTYDVLALEMVAVFQWFNPFFWMFRRALRENHEFLADQAVISKGTAPSWYKQILINQYVGDQIVLANNFNSSLIKNRIQMISKIKSRKMANIKILIGFVLAASLVAVFACEQKKSETAEVVPAGKTVTIIADGKPLQITGEDAGIEKLKSVIAESENYVLKSDPATGALNLVNKSNKTDEIVVVGYGEEEKLGKAPEEVFTVVEQMPEFLGGMNAMQQFLMKSVLYPQAAREKGIQGKVYVTFVVGKEGSVSNVKIVRGVHPLLDAEALRVVNAMPKWTPGKQSGKDVAVQFTIPIKFTLQ